MGGSQSTDDAKSSQKVTNVSRNYAPNYYYGIRSNSSYTPSSLIAHRIAFIPVVLENCHISVYTVKNDKLLKETKADFQAYQEGCLKGEDKRVGAIRFIECRNPETVKKAFSTFGNVVYAAFENCAFDSTPQDMFAAMKNVRGIEFTNTHVPLSFLNENCWPNLAMLVYRGDATELHKFLEKRHPESDRWEGVLEFHLDLSDTDFNDCSITLSPNTIIGSIKLENCKNMSDDNFDILTNGIYPHVDKRLNISLANTDPNCKGICTPEKLRIITKKFYRTQRFKILVGPGEFMLNIEGYKLLPEDTDIFKFNNITDINISNCGIDKDILDMIINNRKIESGEIIPYNIVIAINNTFAKILGDYYFCD